MAYELEYFHPSTIATAGESGNIHCWDTAYPDKALASVSCQSEVNALALTERPQHLAAACGNGTLLAWPVAGAEAIISEASVIRLALYVASGSMDSTCRLWNASSGECISILRIPTAEATSPASGTKVAVNSVTLSNLGGKPTLVTAHSDHAIRIWDVQAIAAKGEAQDVPLIATLLEHADAVTHCCSTSKQLVSCSMDASVKFWNWDGVSGGLDHSNYDFVKALTKVHVANVSGKEVLYALGEEGVVRGWDCDTMTQVVALDVEVAEEECVQLNDLIVFPTQQD